MIAAIPMDVLPPVTDDLRDDPDQLFTLLVEQTRESYREAGYWPSTALLATDEMCLLLSLDDLPGQVIGMLLRTMVQSFDPWCVVVAAEALRAELTGNEFERVVEKHGHRVENWPEHLRYDVVVVSMETPTSIRQVTLVVDPERNWIQDFDFDATVGIAGGMVAQGHLVGLFEDDQVPEHERS